MNLYWIHSQNQNNILNEGYVGITNDFYQRMASHKSESLNAKYPLYKAIRKHGWDNLIKEIVLIGDSDYCKSIEKKLRPFKKIGWNLAEGGSMPPNKKGIKQSESHLKNRCAALKGRISGFKGKKQTKEAIEKTMFFVRGVPKSEETKKKNSEAHKKKVKVNGIIYPSWSDASKSTGIPIGSIRYLIKCKPTTGKWAKFTLESVL